MLHQRCWLRSMDRVPMGEPGLDAAETFTVLESYLWSFY